MLSLNATQDVTSMTLPTARHDFIPSSAVRDHRSDEGSTIQEGAPLEPSAPAVVRSPLDVSPRQQRIDRRLLIGLAYGMYGLYMSLPVVSALVALTVVVALAMALRTSTSPVPARAWRTWALAVAGTTLSVLTPMVVHHLGVAPHTPAEWMLRATSASMALLVAHWTAVRLPVAVQRAFCAVPRVADRT